MLKTRLAQVHMHIDQPRNQQLAFRFNNLSGFIHSLAAVLDCGDNSILHHDMFAL
ncbi:hypothetical protein D3C75_1295360 [compost metagenome]